jgi:acyl-coenzyme A synthetase/AMP-(fatty) acid ligase
MFVDFLTAVFEENRHAEAIVWHDRAYSYGWLQEQMLRWQDRVREEGIRPGSVVALEADFSPNSVALFLALVDARCILVPMTSTVESKKPEFFEIAQAEVSFRLDCRDEAEVRRLGRQADHDLYGTLRGREHPGLVLFSSGSTGKSKAAVHDVVGLLEKFKVKRRRRRAISFLLYDHIGGVNTMLYTLSNAGCLVTPASRDADTVLAAVERHRVDLLPTSPTFLNLILLSEAYTRYDLDCLETITYGTEPMPESTLRRLHEQFPHVRLQQTYGLSEVGIMRSKSRSSDSLWMKLGGEDFKTRVVEGILHVKARSAMLGYLNAPSPFTDDGWFVTGDAVVEDGEYLRILGRVSELINVGGQKVFPAEVESVIQEADNVEDVTVHGERNPITGQIVCARVTLQEAEDAKQFAQRLKRFCRERLESYKVPVKVELAGQSQHGARFKRMRLVEQ